LFSHGFQGPTGKWYLENSLTTLGENDPVSDLNTKLWNSGSEANKEIVRKQKRKLGFTANILVVSDPKHPENEGKVFLFRFGKKVFDKIMDWEGANFKLRMRKKDGYSNYDESAFMEPSAVSEDEDKLLKIVNSQHKLSEFLDRKNFKTYDELKTKLDQVLSGDSFSGKSAAEIAEQEDMVSAPAFTPKASKPAPQAKSVDADDDDADVMSYFKKIASEQ
jgi:hypothetical protein